VGTPDGTAAYIEGRLQCDSARRREAAEAFIDLPQKLLRLGPFANARQ
jgi:hypothetical protein